MNVTELIELTNRLSTDKSELTPKERAAYLQYLNMANDELYEIASSGLSSILVNQVVYFSTLGTFKDTGVFILPNNLFKIDGVFIDQVSLKKRNFGTATTVIAPDEYVPYRNFILSNVGNSSLKYPTAIDETDGVNKKYLYITYYPNPKRLVEEINDDNLETDTPVYPLPYHIFLVHGALYYFYFSNKVFMDKMAYIRNVWENDKKILANFKNYGL